MSVKLSSVHDLISQELQFKLEVKLILRHVLDLTAAQLIMASHRVLTQEELEQFNELRTRLYANEPLNYILGYREFYSREFKVTPDTLIPRPETEILVEQAIQLVKPGMQFLDLGTGSGCIAITAKLEYSDIEVTAVDKYPQTLAIAMQNSISLSAKVEFLVSNWYAELQGRKFDIIVSNPPYIVANDIHLSNLSYEPQHALTDFNDGLDCLRIIIANAPKYLNHAGYLLVEHGYDQGSAVVDLFQSAGFSQIKARKDYAGNDRITFGQYI